MSGLQATTIQQQCKDLRVPAIGSQFARLAEQAVREKQNHLDYLEALLNAELEERERNTVERRLRDAHLPRMKTLEEFDFAKSPKISPAQIRELAEGGYVQRAEPVLFVGECGTGKTHLMTGLCVAACRQKRRVRFATTAGLVNELVEAKHQLQLRRVLARWARYELIAIDEVGVRAVGGSGCGVSISGHRRTRREGGSDHDHQSALFGVDTSNSECPVVQSTPRSDYRPGAYHRDGQ